MIQIMKKGLKEQRGFTLVELLAVIVILGIIAAIAVPAIGNVIENSKKDAFAANAQQMVSSGRIAVTSETSIQNGTYFLPLGYLVEEGYIDTISDPFDGTYDISETTTANEPTDHSYIKVKDGNVTKVYLTNGIQEVTSDSPFNDLDRDKVTE